MYFNPRALLAASLASAVSASPLFPRQNGTATSACGAVASLVQSAPANSTPTVPAQTAWECIQSVPLNTTGALELMRTIRPYLNWQSTTAYLKDPPAEYVEKIQQPIDILGGIDEIEANLKAGTWKTEFDFGFAFYTLLQQTHDGHLSYIPDIVGRIFNWARPVPLVSVSEDGEKLPSIFVYADILTASTNQAFDPSPVTQINGEDAIPWLENWSQIGSLQDRDALWNNAFYSLAPISLAGGGTSTGTFSGGGRGRWIYPGPTTELTFANGSTVSYTNIARVLVPFTGIASGEDLVKAFFTYPDLTVNLQQGAKAPATAQEASVKDLPAPGYPPPVFRESQNNIGGYYIADPDYADVAVLSVPSFEGFQEFQQVGQNFLAAAKAAGKKKLIIDVSANGGGIILQGYDLFKQLFPQIDPYAAADRFRGHEAYDIIGQVVSEVSGKYNRSLDIPDDNIVDLISSPQNYRSDLDPVTNEHFTSWPKKYGPEEHHGDKFTKLFRWWLADPLTIWNSGGIEVTGYGNRSTGFTQPFQASDIVIVYDGYCASTCTIFSELMRRLAGVETIAMGGRADNDDIIQAVGGTKGTNNYPWNYIQQLAAEAYNLSTPEQQASYPSTELATYNNLLPFARAVGSPNVNARDGIQKGDTTSTPLQFHYEEADCRLFYTPEMTVDITAVWKAAADAKWSGADCVAGGVGGGYGKRRANKRAAKSRSSTTSAKVGALDAGKAGALWESLNTMTEVRMGHGLDGYMAP